MKVHLLIVLTTMATAVLTPGCVGNRHEIVVETVGPRPAEVAHQSSAGTLIVYSAFEQSAHFNDSLERVHYSDYQLYSASGELLQKVHNDDNVQLGPKRITLSAGSYRIVARANGYGYLTVPATILNGQVTAIHLEGGFQNANRDHKESDDVVRLPGGEIAGWRGGK